MEKSDLIIINKKEISQQKKEYKKILKENKLKNTGLIFTVKSIILYFD